LSEFDPVEPWLKSLSEGRRKAHQSALDRFCKFCKMSPTNLLVETREALFRLDPPPFRSRLIEWQKELEVELRPATIQQYRMRVLSFLGYHIERLGREFGSRSYRVSSILFDPLQQREVKDMVEVAADPYYKALIGFLAQTGQRTAVVRGITWGMIDCEEHKPYGIAMVPPKLKDKDGATLRDRGSAYTFIVGKDAMSLLDQWPETKKRKEEKTFVFDSSARQIHRIVAYAAQSANVQADSQKLMPDKAKLYRVHPDTFPTYWNGRVRDGGMDELQRKSIMGRDVSYEPRERDLFSVDRLLSAYRAAEPLLAIFELPG
jgi:integrase